jgi:hypothetical protein
MQTGPLDVLASDTFLTLAKITMSLLLLRTVALIPTGSTAQVHGQYDVLLTGWLETEMKWIDDSTTYTPTLKYLSHYLEVGVSISPLNDLGILIHIFADSLITMERVDWVGVIHVEPSAHTTVPTMIHPVFLVDG